MSQHVMFRRQPVQPQAAPPAQATTLLAPTRGIIESESLAFMKPGGAILMDNWLPTLRGVKLRGGCTRWCDLHPGLALNDPLRQPIISSFEYVDGNNHRMFVGQETNLWDVTGSPATLVKGGQTDGNYTAAQLSNDAGRWMVVVNDAGDAPLRFNGLAWATLPVSGLASDGIGTITGPLGVPAPKLVHAWKYRNRMFFIEQSSMNAWYLPLNAVGGNLAQIPLSGGASKGGNLKFGATWSIDAGDGIDDKCCFVTDLGEILIFTGSDPGDAANWRQEGRYQVPPPLGKNASISLGGDLLIATVDGIIPVSKAITKTAEELQLAAITHNINRTWREQVLEKREFHWSMKKWDEFGGLLVAAPGSKTNKRYSFAANSISLAWCRLVGWDVMCWIRMRGDCFFGTQSGIVMQCDRTGYDDGLPYLASLIGAWGALQSGAQTSVWHQARASFLSGAAEPFQPQLGACVDYQVKLPPAPVIGPDPGILDVWDQGLWDQALWDQPAPTTVPIRNTRWVSIGRTGYTHAPVVQVYVGQQARPNVELIAIDVTFNRLGVTV